MTPAAMDSPPLRGLHVVDLKHGAFLTTRLRERAEQGMAYDRNGDVDRYGEPAEAEVNGHGAEQQSQ